MSNVNKILKYQLQNEVDPLLEQKVPYQKIAEALKINHPEIEDLSKLSAMNVMRYKDDKQEKAMEIMLDEGKDPVDDFTKEYRAAIRQNNIKVESLLKECEDILDLARQSTNIPDRVKSVEVTLKSLDQIKRNWESLSQFGIRQLPRIGNVNLKKEQNVKILILSVANKLCPKCSNEMLKVLDEHFKEDEVKEIAKNS